MSQYDFNTNQLDQRKLNAFANRETKNLYASPKARKGRSYLEIFETVIFGAAAEMAMIDLFGAKNNPEKYGDIIFEGQKVEIKTWSKPWTDRAKQTSRSRVKSYNPSEIMMFWHTKDGKNYIYDGQIEL